ncbi:hypothetical protein [Paractinoplanes rishiriensis]|uniref:Uncharacterized protein n=1 Tax=Paractinoplanes rishiriensis TaxID=1050105 RepID=A0A919MV00_9ACTN|nr:hypothetical protein [Actinoplanes rishiriensis]GIE96308.1 hypothetical protein Ari01nite_37730 [Actinoplanes rishiriensis]
MTYPENIDLETPEADAAEQAASARLEDDGLEERSTTLADETPVWDAQEQHRVVELDDDYR